MTRHCWIDWSPLPLNPPPANARVLSEVLDGGQAFRWYPVDATSWQGTWAGCHAQVRLEEGSLQWRAPSSLADHVRSEIPPYFNGSVDYRALTANLPVATDPHLARCVARFPGLRLLKQPFGETLLAYFCSAAKRIVQIKQMLALVAKSHGKELVGSNSNPDGAAQTPVHSLPSWDALAEISESDLRGCRLGFRARHVHRTALFLRENPGWLEQTEHAPYTEAKERLMTLPGVGEKVADCVLLYGGGKLEAFPVDTWILKAMARRYGLDGWKPAQVSQFGRAHFGPLAGLAQQYLFGWERAHADSPTP
jgi:N-glycosylase/DNA lyase